MNNLEISDLIVRHPEMRIPFAGVYALDTLPIKPEERRPLAYIVNTAPSYTRGEHWICMYFPVNDFPEFFDSYAFSPHPEFVAFMGGHYRKSNTWLQGFLSTVCGQYCIFYIYMRYILGMNVNDILAFLHGKGRFRADEYVNRFIEAVFRTDLDVVNISFLMDQIE